MTARCPLERTRIIRQEGEQTTQRELAVQHTGHDYILNTGQMRNAALIQPHYIPFSTTRTRDDIIHQAAMREVALTRRNQTARDQPGRSATSAVPARSSRAGSSATSVHPTPSGERLHSQSMPLTSPLLIMPHAPPTSGRSATCHTPTTTSRPPVPNHAHRTALLSSYNIS